MVTATKKNESTSTKADREVRVKCFEAEAMLSAIVQAGRGPTLNEATWFRTSMGWDNRLVRREIGRIKATVEAQAIAGTSADREATKRQAESAAELLESEGRQVQRQISELESKLRSMERDAAAAQRRVEQQAEAVERLKKLVPEAIADEVRQKQSDIDHSLGRELAEAEGRHQQLRVCLDRPEGMEPKQHIEAIERLDRRAVEWFRLQGQLHDRRVTPQWASLRPQYEDERDELAEKIEALKSEIAAAHAEAAKPLEHYCR
jgi:chromosome segregation ATPase